MRGDGKSPCPSLSLNNITVITCEFEQVFSSSTPPFLIPNLVFPFSLFTGRTLAESSSKLVRFRRWFTQNASNLERFGMMFPQFQYLPSKKTQQ